MPDDKLKDLSDQAGIKAAAYRGDMPRVKHLFTLIDVLGLPSEATRLDPLAFDVLTPAHLEMVIPAAP